MALRMMPLSDIIAFLPLHIQMAPHLNGNIPAISIIDQILKRNDHLTPGIVLHAVIMVCHGNEAHAKHGKYLLDISPGLNIVAPEPREILHDHAVHRAVLYILHHLLEIRPVKINAAVSVILIHGMNPDIGMGFQIIPNQLLLIGNAVAEKLSAFRHIAVFFG